MTPQLESITLTDFRSITGSVFIPLDAPVVLIHGQNGTGKTSILSGLELALTGDIPSLRRVDPEYRRHLVHKSAIEGRLDVRARGLLPGIEQSSIVVKSDSITGGRLLSGELAKTYSERCYLPQATLGRLLEIYQSPDARSSSSPLTLFVKELLGLDALESLIDGLHDAGDIRRVRNTVPAYAENENRIAAAQRRITQIDSDIDRVDVAIRAHTQNLRQGFSRLDLTLPEKLVNLEELLPHLQALEAKSRLMHVARTRRDLFAASESLNRLHNADHAAQRTLLAKNNAEAAERLQLWRQHNGSLLNEIFEPLLSSFPSLPSPATVDPEVARLAAVRAIDEEIARHSQLLSKEEEGAKRLAGLQRSIDQLQERSQRLEEQISTLASDAGALAQALGGIISHIHSEECPVCGRDYREISPVPLESTVSQRIASLNESAGRLEALLRERATTQGQLTAARRDHENFLASQLSQVETEETNAARANLLSLKMRLEEMAEAAQLGTVLLRESSNAARALSEALESDSQMSVLIETVRGAAASLEQPFEYPSTSLSETVSQLLAFCETEEAALNVRERERESAMAELRGLQTRLFERRSLGEERDKERTLRDQLQETKDKADGAIETARALSRKCVEVRTSIVRRVFNDSLNKLWADLFTRLAPDEDFVPAFALPTRAAGAVEAILETIHRRGLKGGNPQAMLSAGNLNTAALTLFLALHLSLDSKLPWLLIDDPVQSMDEVHISQFAALLRTLSKQSDRSVLIAIHERPLYEYLALELSPAFLGDKLITVELGRNATGSTIAKATHHIWREDKAISAA